MSNKFSRPYTPLQPNPITVACGPPPPVKSWLQAPPFLAFRYTYFLFPFFNPLEFWTSSGALKVLLCSQSPTIANYRLQCPSQPPSSFPLVRITLRLDLATVFWEFNDQTISSFGNLRTAPGSGTKPVPNSPITCVVDSTGFTGVIIKGSTLVSICPN